MSENTQIQTGGRNNTWMYLVGAFVLLATVGVLTS
jgi:LPXTG-motif cell wall-anchored protein